MGVWHHVLTRSVTGNHFLVSAKAEVMAGTWEALGEQLEALNQYLQERPLAVLCSVFAVIVSSWLLWRCLSRYGSKKKRESLRIIIPTLYVEGTLCGVFGNCSLIQET